MAFSMWVKGCLHQIYSERVGVWQSPDESGCRQIGLPVLIKWLPFQGLLSVERVQRMHKLKNKHRQHVKGYNACMQCKTALIEFIEDLK